MHCIYSFQHDPTPSCLRQTYIPESTAPCGLLPSALHFSCPAHSPARALYTCAMQQALLHSCFRPSCPTDHCVEAAFGVSGVHPSDLEFCSP